MTTTFPQVRNAPLATSGRRLARMAIGSAALALLAAASAASAQSRQPQPAPPTPAVDPASGDRLAMSEMVGNMQLTHVNAVIRHRNRRGLDGGGIAGTCPPTLITYNDPAIFNGGSFLIEQGSVETEIAAAEFVLPASAFPVVIRTTEMILGRIPSSVTETTQYSILYWEGPPNSGTLVDSFSSSPNNDPGDPPQLVIPPGQVAAGVNVQLTIDPSDADQIVINDNPTHSFTIGYRIDHHNSPPTASCLCAGTFPRPAQCCPPTPSLNTFFTADTNGVANNAHNWYLTRACGDPCDPGGWFHPSSLGISGDFVARATYEPTGCGIPTGACCLNGGAQCVGSTTQSACLAANGTYQGDNTNCNNGCPPPTGACCINGNCTQTTAADCATQGGVFGGIGVACNANTCTNSVCCVPSTQQCVQTSQANCAFANGTFHPGTTCGTFVCFPMGACCLENGQCNAGPMSPAQCAALGGTFAGNNSTCATANCPAPVGACCMGANCAPTATTQATCAALGGTWAYPAPACGPNVCPYCPSDINHTGSTDVNDLLAVISVWGPCVNCPGDVAPTPFGDNVVNVNDLLLIVSHWGSCQ